MKDMSQMMTMKMMDLTGKPPCMQTATRRLINQKRSMEIMENMATMWTQPIKLTLLNGPVPALLMQGKRPLEYLQNQQ